MKTGVKQVIWNTLRQHLWLTVGLVLAVAGAVAAALVPPGILGRIVDQLSAGAAVPFWTAAAYFGMLALAGLLESAREVLLTVFGQKITHGLRSSLMEKLTRLTTARLSGQEPGSLVSRFVGDVDTVENLFTSGIVSMFADVCTIISILAVIWVRNRGLSLILLALLPLLYWFTRHVQKNMLTAQIENRRAVSRASSQVPQTLHNIRTIHCLSKERYMEGRYDRAIGESYRAMEKTNFYDAVYSPVILTLNTAVVALVMLLSAAGSPGVLRLFGMSAGTAVTVMNYIGQIFAPVESLGMEIQTIQSAVAGIHRINEFFSWEERTVPAPRQAIPGSPVAELRDVTFGYDDKVVLQDKSFRVEQGDQVTLMGRTGAGKSTVLKLLLGLYTPQQGQVFIRGVSPEAIPPKKRRQWFGYVEQSFHMVPGTVRDQITLFDSTIPEEQLRGVAELTGLSQTIDDLPQGFDTICTPELFSQGQWQLLSIARAAVTSPELLLLDEITANLDAETEQTVLRALKAVSENRTVISISHRTSAEMGKVVQI